MPPWETLHSAFDEQAAASPNAVAAVCCAGCNASYRQSLTYAAVCERSASLSAGIKGWLCRSHFQGIDDIAGVGEQAGGDVGRPPVVAVHVPRTHPDFVPLLVACSRASVAFVLMSTDLPDRAMENQRNALIMKTLRPQLRVIASRGSGDSGEELTATTDDLEALAASSSRTEASHCTPADILCFLFTGGTFRTKVVEATHAMFLHERRAYCELWRPSPGGPRAIVLAHTSVYWGASALGQLSIALAFGGTAVWAEDGADTASTLHRLVAEEGVTVLGVVPDHLDLLAPEDPAHELPAVEVVFTWGERLPRRVADRWRRHPRAVLRELLISTEYWLALWADPLGDGVLRPVRDAEVLVLKQDGGTAEVGEIGELCLAGPMVMHGYLPLPLESHTSSPPSSSSSFSSSCRTPFHLGASGRRYFRTSDLVRRLQCGVVYKGRADMMTKSKGKWVDMLELEDRISQMSGILAVKILPDTTEEHYHAFAVLDGGSGGSGASRCGAVGASLDGLRAALPPHVQLWLVPELPRHPVTRKVDAQRLLRLIAAPPPSWPLEGDPRLGAAPAVLRARLLSKLLRHAVWTLVMFGAACVVADTSNLRSQLALASAWLGALAVSARHRRGSAGGSTDADKVHVTARALSLTSAWLAAALTSQAVAVSQDRGLAPRLAGCTTSCALLSYLWLALIYADDARASSQVARAVMRVVDEVPMHKLGVFIALSLARRLPWPAGELGKVALLGGSAFGAYVAFRRRRLLAWPLVLWACGAGHQLEVECTAWLRFGTWRMQLARLASAALPPTVLAGPPAAAANLESARRCLPVVAADKGSAAQEGIAGPVAVEPLAVVEPLPAVEEPAPAARCCAHCRGGLGVSRWNAHDDAGCDLCVACGAASAAKLESAAAAFLARLVVGDDRAVGTEPSPKRQRMADKDDCDEAAAEVTASTVYGGSDGHCPCWSHGSRRHPSAVVNGHLEAGVGGHGGCHTSDHTVATILPADEPWHAWDHKRIEAWWWYNQVTNTFDLDSEEERRFARAIATEAAPPPQVEEPLSPNARLLCTALEQIEPLLRPVRIDTALTGLDSLRVARLAGAVRRQLGRSLSLKRIREAATVAELVAAARDAEEVSASSACSSSTPAASCSSLLGEPDSSREYAIWYSPGQYTPMGHWVLRTEDALDHGALLRATQQLVERHGALRTKIIDPLRYMSLIYDAATIFSLYAPLLDTYLAPFRALRRLISRALCQAWPRVKCYSREVIYGERFPGTAAPLHTVRITQGQCAFERELKDRRFGLVPPGAVTAYELVCHLADVWTWERGWKGRFVICPSPAGGVDGPRMPAHVKLVYVDPAAGDWGPLIGPSGDGWRPPPYGFPALFFVPLSSGAVAWLRLERADELRVCYRAGASRTLKNFHLTAFRAAPERWDADDKDATAAITRHRPIVLTFLGVCMFHSFADGNCYLPLVQDLLSLYDAARGNCRGGILAPPASLPPLGDAWGELERRLFDTFHCRQSPVRTSLRGSIFRYSGLGYGYDLGLEPGAIGALTRAAAHYRTPLDIALLGLVTCAMARADRSDLLEFTLYAPMRDGVSEVLSVGLFSDWRDLAVAVDFGFATTLGTVLQIGHKIQHRQWAVFNALRKPERMIVNIQPLDFERRAGFVHLGENLWHGGDQLCRPRPMRGSRMEWARQPATLVIEQQDEETWWILASVASEARPPPWMRRFVFSFHEAVRSFLFEPLTRVHRPVPDDSVLLRRFHLEGAAGKGRWG